jgi:hypothetical protein
MERGRNRWRNLHRTSDNDISIRPFRHQGEFREILQDASPRDQLEWHARDLVVAVGSDPAVWGDRCAGKDGKASVVGGGVDVVSLGPEGARLERLVDWDDPIGMPVDPFRGMARAEWRRVQRMVAVARRQ